MLILDTMGAKFVLELYFIYYDQIPSFTTKAKLKPFGILAASNVIVSVRKFFITNMLLATGQKKPGFNLSEIPIILHLPISLFCIVAQILRHDLHFDFIIA